MDDSGIRDRIDIPASADRLFIDIAPLIVVAILGYIILAAERALYPFKEQRRVASRAAFFAALWAAVLFTNASINSPPPRWYPYPASWLIFIPVLLYMLTGVVRRYRI